MMILPQAGFFPAATYLLTCWYRRGELQGRLAVFFSAGSMAGAFSGLLAFGINNMDGVANLAGWRWYDQDWLPLNYRKPLANIV